MRPKFDYSLPYDRLNLRSRPSLYRVGVGEQGVLLVEPYKSEILPLWRFKTEAIATESAKAIYALFLRYKRQRDFVGMDMARKFLQMGYTRARRYANHAGGRKYDDQGKVRPRGPEDPEKAAAAKVFYAYYVKARSDPTYQRLKREHQDKYG